MNGPKTFTNYAFQISIFCILLIIIMMLISAIVDIVFGMDWGYTWNDILTAFIVMCITLVVKFIGHRIIVYFSDGY